MDNCGRCGQPEDEHTPGQRCPGELDVDGESPHRICKICKMQGPRAVIEHTPCPHSQGSGTAANALHLLPGNAKRRGRPVGTKTGTGFEAAQRIQQMRINKATRKVVVESIVGAGIRKLDDTLIGAAMPPNRASVPERTIADLKDSALKLLNQQLWNIEGRASERELTEDEEARLLKLLAGFNAALPKAAEKPPEKPLSEMTDEELERIGR